MTPTSRVIEKARLLLVIGLAAVISVPLAHAALTELADVPLASSSSDAVKPNIMFILDDSGSMRLKFMPDGLRTRENRIGFRNHQCNLVYYSPNITYVIPKTSTGTNVNAAVQTSFTSAYDDGFWGYNGSGSGTSNLGTSFRAFTDDNLSYSTDENDASQPAYYWKYLGATTLVPLAGDCEKTLTSSSDTTTQEYCTDGTRVTTTCASQSPVKTALWRKIIVSSTSGPGATDERQNFAIWYSYYRIRMNMMKSATGRAFLDMDDTFRIGFITINPDSPVSSGRFLAIGDFDTAQKTSWFNKLYAQGFNGSTPLREALSRVGRYFSGKTNGINNGMSGDPVQYSCQQNFSILTTDGYWNGNTGKKLDGTTNMDNQDGLISELDAYRPTGSKYAMSPRPIYDGASQTYTWNTASIEHRYADCTYGTQPQQRTSQYQICTSTNSLRKRTSSNSGNSWTAWYFTSSCTPDNSGGSRTACSYGGTGQQTRTSWNYGSTWTDWSDTTGSCSPDNNGSSRRECRNAYKCESTATWTNGQCTNTDETSLPLCRSTSGPWSDVASCTPVPQDVSGAATECQALDIAGKKIQYQPRTTATVYPGPNQTGSALSGPDTTTSSWTDLTGACYLDASKPALPADGTVIGGGPPPPPEGCIGGSQVWPCETYSSGGGGASVSINSLSVSGSEDPYTVTATTSSAHPFLVGHSVNITGVTSAYGGYQSITDVPSSTQFSYQVATHPGVGDGTGSAQLSSGSDDSLADVAQYYYKTDLRASALGNCTGALGVSVCDNNVPSTGTGNEDDRANWQHMTTFTMGLGLTGTVQYSPTYKQDSPDNVVIWPAVNGQITGRLDFQDIRKGTFNWPIAQSDGATALDDLWHAAVNGRGQYFSAGDPDTVVDSISSALSGISARVGSAAAAATSNLEPVAGDNFAYTASYVTQDWVGELEAREINLETGAVGTNPIWSAQTELDKMGKSACDNRIIKLFRAGATNNLVNFTWNTYACDGSGNPTGAADTSLIAAEQVYFDASEVALLSQSPSMTAAQSTAAAGSNLVNFVRGQRGKEGFEDTDPDVNKLYRSRAHILGDIVNAQPVFVRAPFAEYDDAGYSAYKSANLTRSPAVFAAANDGMLHAFHADTGIERWAFMPTMVLPELYKLASSNYANQHTYYTDGTPSVGDVLDTTASADCALPTPSSPEDCWKTILVAGMNKGGKGYYALDITDPATPKALWEFKHSTTCYDSGNSTTWSADCHLGYTFNNPIISKLNNGRWVVFVTSGYNNVNSPTLTGDGQGYLYVLDAITGNIIYKIGTGAGSAASPSGLNHISGWVNVNSTRNNLSDRIYGVDMNGNIWRFDINDSYLPAGREATLVAQVVDGSGVPQPITTKPELAEIQTAPFVYVATGRYLGSTDLSNTQTQTVWAIKDPLTTTAVTNLRTTLAGWQITNQGSGTSAYRTSACVSTCGSTSGWFNDLPDSGERVNVDIKLQLGTLVVASNVPVSNACNIGGYSWLNYFNSTTGGAVTNSTNQSVGVKLVGSDGTESLAVGLNVVRLPSGKTVVIATTSAAQQVTIEAPFDVPPPTGKRVSWREIAE